MRRNISVRSGHLVPVEVVVDVDRDEGGEIRGYFSFVTDATERKAAERAVRESEERFRKLYDEAPVGYHEIDRDGRIVIDQPDRVPRCSATPGPR